MANKKVVFVAFAMEDERQRDFLRGQSLLTSSPFEYIDLSVKEAYESDWKEKVRTRAEMGNRLREGRKEEDPWNLGSQGRQNRSLTVFDHWKSRLSLVG
jgi:hypothetical protein